MPETMEQTFYSAIVDDSLSGLESFPAELFCPSEGTILVILPPKIAQIGAIVLPENAQQDQCIAKVAAIPSDPECPVTPGDWVVYRLGSPTLLFFKGRKDYALLEYRKEGSDLLGWFRERDVLDVLEIENPEDGA